ncbi:MAG TPA: hydantoinase/oxoprolinase family protein [Candidatus Limnocylindrales bacterium]|jgi:N-methylhydantoinase A|nr:hydantoinase/oxoprolinase family protein [Candidatus Limnocylindrales bacterium]
MTRDGTGRAMLSRVGVDVGGTFTDVVVTDADGGMRTGKVPSTPEDFSTGVSGGVRDVLETHGLDPATVRNVVHGSTVATNAILERKGARTGLLTTAGFIDVLELRRLRMPKLYDLTWEKPAPLVPRFLRREIPERVDIAGEVVTPLDLDAVRRSVADLVAAGVESLAVCLLHAYANPSHEKAIGAMIAAEFPDLWVSLSSRVLPVIREYERTSTTVLNAYVQPTVASYLTALRGQLDDANIPGRLLIMQSNGGIMSGAAASERPAYIVESGPAAGVIASAALARREHIDEVITFDMGGTTAKASIVENGRPQFTAEFEVAAGISASSRLSSGGGYALSVPFIDLAEIGAGGGSLIWIDPGGAPKVGPTSAGAIPGPVCYDKGGERPTVTDVNLALGYLNPDGLLDGAMPLEHERARAVFKREIADPLGLDPLVAAYGCHELANATMIRAIKTVTVQRGRDPRVFTLVAFGGSGPIHAAGIARELGVRKVLVPPSPGVFSAVGLLQARLEFHAKKTHLRRTRDIRPDELDAQIGSLEADARDGLGVDTQRDGRLEFTSWAEMRYAGQGFELPVQLPPRGGSWSAWLRKLDDAFEAEHETTYGHRTGNATEVVHLRVVAREAEPPPFPTGGRDASRVRPVERRPAYFGERFGLVVTPVIRRRDLTTDRAIGPFVVEDYDATTVVPPDFTARRDDSWNIVIEAAS